MEATQQAEAVQQLHSLQDFVRWGSSQLNASDVFFGHGNDNAIDEVMAIVLHVLHLDLTMPENFWAARLTLSEKQHIVGLLARRINERVPVPYLTGTTWFAGLSFHVDPRVLIPRSPFAELIEQGFAPWLEINEVQHVLEIGTGSGCIAIATALTLPDTQVDAVDISKAALALAAQNVGDYNLQKRVILIESDVYESLPNKAYDLIVSNPPYVNAEDLAEMPAEYHHEPSLGLAAGEDGLDIVRRILAKAADYLTPKGILIIEVGDSAPALLEAYPDLDFTWLHFDQGGSGVFLLDRQQCASLTQ